VRKIQTPSKEEQVKLYTLSKIAALVSAQPAIVLASIMISTPFAVAEGVRDLKDFNLQNGVGLHSHDPVAVYPEGGGRPQRGHEQLKLDYKGVTYLFSSGGNIDFFMQNPRKYEPTYGGFCAYAMAQGCKIDIDPSLYTLKVERAHYFVSNRAKRNFDADADVLEAQADANYARMQGLNVKAGECLP